MNANIWNNWTLGVFGLCDTHVQEYYKTNNHFPCFLTRFTRVKNQNNAIEFTNAEKIEFVNTVITEKPNVQCTVTIRPITDPTKPHCYDVTEGFCYIEALQNFFEGNLIMPTILKDIPALTDELERFPEYKNKPLGNALLLPHCFYVNLFYLKIPFTFQSGE